MRRKELTRASNYGLILHEGMEEEQKQSFRQVEQPVGEQANVAFPTPPVRKEGGKALKWVFAVVGVLLIVGAGVWFLFSNYPGSKTEATPTPFTGGLSSFVTPEPEETVTPTPVAKSVDKTAIKIEVLNGTGKAGEAGFLKSRLEKEGFGEVTAGNNEDQDQTQTTVTYGGGVGQSEIDEVSGILEEIYEKVRVRKGALEEVDIRIVIGPRKGSGVTGTASPQASPSPSPTGNEV